MGKPELTDHIQYCEVPSMFSINIQKLPQRAQKVAPKMAKINFQMATELTKSNNSQSHVPNESLGPVEPKNSILKVRFGNEVTVHSFSPLQQSESDSQISEYENDLKMNKIGTVGPKATEKESSE